MHWIHRLGSPRTGFRYVSDSGQPVRARAVLARIDALRIPPAYRDVHIAADPRASVQAWGFDARGRKQYRYHARAVERGQLRKYHRVARLARDLPAIRAAITRDFSARGLGKRKVAAGVVRLIAEGYLRVGSDRYARENHSYGTTTLHKRHARVDAGSVVLEYIGKRGIPQHHVIADRALAAFVRELEGSPGRRLFRYLEGGAWHDLTASDVNAYLRRLVGVPYTTKDFRTWGGTLHAAMVLADVGPAASQREAKRNVVMAIRIVAAELGNTPAICRKAYIHPIVLAEYLDHGLTITRDRRARPRGARPRIVAPPSVSAIAKHDPWVAWSPDERALIAFLAEHFPERRRRPRAEGEPRPGRRRRASAA